ncbi:MAG: M36 family metallopeptidase, partial [Bacteroidota bacterium]
MSREKDVRDFTINRAIPNRVSELHSLAADVSGKLPGSHTIRIEKFNSTNGNPSAIVSDSAPAGTGNYIARALDHVHQISPALGLTAQQATEFIADPAVQVTSSEARSVNLQQLYKGIPIFQSAVTINFAPDGAITDTLGSTSTVSQNLLAEPKLTVQKAVLCAAQHVAKPAANEKGKTDQFGEPFTPPEVKITGFEPKVRAAFPNLPERPTVLEPGPFGAEIKANLIWFPLGDNLSLGWAVLLTFPNYTGQYYTIVSADTGDIFYCHQTILYLTANGNVYRVNGGSARQSTPFPRPINDYNLPFPTVAQNNWRWCHKCQGIYFAGNPGSHCPAGGAHDLAGSADYYLSLNSAGYPGQNNWRWCHKCQGLYFAGNPGSVCPAGGAHDMTGSGNYTLQNQRPFAPGQHGWRWCRKCQSLFFEGNPGSHCSAGGAHDSTGSGDYSLLFNAATGLPPAFPDPWVTANKTVGNSTNAHLGDAGLPYTGTTSGGALTFNPADAVGDDQKVLNIFYYCCYMHDFFYMLKFREIDGNFQQDDFGRGGTGGDPVDARSYSGAVSGTANMSTPVDGSSPTMRMGLVTSTNRHTAFDSTVVFHEFTHGVTNRLVGGPMNVHALDAPQSGGMGEGWGDYVACTINDVIIVGNWLLNNAGGVRYFPYDSNYPHNFGDLGKIVAGIDYSEVHNMGEIWCATLLEMNRRTDKYFAIQCVVDALKLAPANPGFLNMRDAILSAMQNMCSSGRINGNQ